MILSDHGLPTFNGFEALAVARKECPDVPFIFVTGLMGEEKAIETFERGAIDYVLKSRLSKLVPVVQRAVREAILDGWLACAPTTLGQRYLQERKGRRR